MKAKTRLLLTGIMMFIFSGAFSCEKPDSGKIVNINSSAYDSTEYELIVFDPGYEFYLNSQPSREFYSENYYKTWNIQYVSEWNSRYISKAITGLYDSFIEYDPKIEYGLVLEYKLYYFFRYFEKKNNVTLIQRGN